MQDKDPIKEQMIWDYAGEVELEYVDDNGVPVPELAEQVILEGYNVEEYIEEEVEIIVEHLTFDLRIVFEQLHEDDMAESLDALSRNGEFSHISGTEYVVENTDPRCRQPLILRRFEASHQPCMEQEQDIVESSQFVVEEFRELTA
ncbi:hypothetical protein KIN20_033481 [Parelaphostrongylus tenuis]|uniref:Uncharacterized protein n=1 Tax=Parelaphostrongylus tenuis TaxID=148309 RepID=A0AAD5R8R5_PARTN|nr:hypothetical protein KIN20_033481 [Parelaphostrongylus tenuis]